MSFTSFISGNIGVPFVSQALSPVLEFVGQKVQAEIPVHFPAPQLLMEARRRKLISGEAYATGMASHGCDLQEEPRATLWNQSLLALRDYPSMALISSLLVRGLADPRLIDEAIKHAGGSHNDYVACIEAFRERLTTFELNTLRNRDKINDSEWANLTTRYGGYAGFELPLRNELRFILPSPSDMVQFGVKESFDLDAVVELGLDKGAPPAFFEWMRKSGYGGQGPLIAGPKHGQRQVTWADMFWFAHWRTTPLTDGYRFFHRARDSGGIGGGTRIPGLEPFTSQDLELLQRIADVPEKYRKYYEATSYALPGRRDIHWGLRYKVIDRKEARELFQDNGFNPATAETLTRIEEERIKEEERRRWKNKAIGAIEKAYEVGTVSGGTALVRLADIGLESEEIDERLSAIDLRVATRNATSVVTAVRSSYLNGVIDDTTAHDLLNSGGLAEPRIQQLVSLWRSQLTFPRRQLVTTRILHFYRQLLISRDDVISRLHNLGWADPELLLQVVSTERDIETDLLREQAKQERDEEKRLRKIEQLLRKQRRDHLEARAELERFLNITNLRRWYQDGIISIDEFRFYLKRIEWTDEAIELEVKDQLQK